jgi:transcriptional regulator with PAS, ATPase and Fis domain
MRNGDNRSAAAPAARGDRIADAHFVEHYNRLFGKNIRFVSRQALAVLTAYEWPGNVREFSHAIQSAVMLIDNDRLDVTSVPEHIAHRTNAEVIAQPSASTSQPSEAPAPASEPETKSPLTT